MWSSWKTYFVFFYSFLNNFLRGIFKPEPDTRFKLSHQDNGLVRDSVETTLFPVKVDMNFSIEIEYANENIILRKQGSNGLYDLICGLPITAPDKLLIKIVDEIDNEIVQTYTYEKGDFIDYKKINDDHSLFVK